MVDIASEKQASDIVLLDLRTLSAFTDFFIILNGESSRQLNAIAESIDEELSKQGVQPHHREGAPDSGWLLLDYGAVVVHLFDPQRRGYYELDRVWQSAVPLLRIQ